MATDLRRTALSEEEKRKEVEAKKCREREKKCKSEKGDRESGEGNVDREKSREYRGKKLEEGDLRRKNKESK